MKTSYKIIAIAAPITVVSFVLSRIIWPDPLGAIGPESSLIPHFIFISFLEALSFGLGVAFALLCWLNFRDQIATDRLSLATYVATVWLLVSWWPHDNMHRVNGAENFAGLIRIEYMFHLTLIVAGFIVALYFWRMISKSSINT